MAAKPKILIVGAGPCGLTAALELTRRGFNARIIDKERGPTPLSKAVGISPHSLEILEPSGVTERLLAEGIRMTGVQARYERRLLASIDLSRLPHRFNFLLSLPQSETETVMEEVLGASGVRVEWNVELTAVRLAGAKVETELKGAAGGTFDYVFAADGAHSRVREILGLGFSGYTHKRTWSIADATIPDWPFPEATAMAVLHPTGDLGFIIPIGPKRFRTVSNTPEALSQIPGTDSAQVSQSDTFHIPVRQADRYQAGGVFLGGDAAHVHSPIGARGMNLGIEDAQAFARRLAEGRLDGYTAERHPIGHRWIVLSERMLAGVQTANPLAIPLRNLAIRTIGRLPALQRPMLERVAGLRE
ncbi:MAG TPA: FAD-dependent monooxygenase [Phenylobacterium sp.]|jgi:2-polyprenyl-6-methoxyphenol hydroxylase-like FAD-dependent oxidoreductase|uniref:FAD-dependent oxidoreductase n=1 Tax=Phenylobacterium sp. TaxID=1871053 RepID=UPI002C6D342C|nr:FAD-dependent monooxygenase [Phenylobacterium sp.]HXA37839.1 FAD-dependent monooxygenase [Phenylobacterium sp.]